MNTMSKENKEKLVFKYLQACAGKDKDLSMESFLKENDILYNDQELKDYINIKNISVIKTLQNGGIINCISILDYDNFESYFKSIINRRKEISNKVLEKWIENRPARRYYINQEIKTPKDKKVAIEKDYAFDIIEEFYDEKYFTYANVNKQFIIAKEKSYGRDSSIGIILKKQSYAHQFTLNIKGINGGYTVSNDGNGWDLELEKGAKFFGIIKRYENIPTKEELIDDICIWDLLEKQEPKSKVVTDTSTFNIYPTAKEYFSKK